MHGTKTLTQQNQRNQYIVMVIVSPVSLKLAKVSPSAPSPIGIARAPFLQAGKYTFLTKIKIIS